MLSYRQLILLIVRMMQDENFQNILIDMKLIYECKSTMYEADLCLRRNLSRIIRYWQTQMKQ
jgi:hypothetical protein